MQRNKRLLVLFLLISLSLAAVSFMLLALNHNQYSASHRASTMSRIGSQATILDSYVAKVHLHGFTRATAPISSTYLGVSTQADNGDSTFIYDSAPISWSLPLKPTFSGNVRIDWPADITTDGSATIAAVFSVTKLAAARSAETGVFSATTTDFEPQPNSSDVTQYIRANLAAPDFDSQLVTAQDQEIRGNRVLSWLWVISPKRSGLQTAAVDMSLHWRSKSSGQDTLSDDLVNSPLTITVDQPLLVWGGTISIVSIISAGAVALINVLVLPLMYWRVTAARNAPAAAPAPAPATPSAPSSALPDTPPASQPPASTPPPKRTRRRSGG
jgi:hypothetical protein